MCVLWMLLSCNGKVAQDDDNMHSEHANIVEIYLIDSLDEPRGFCLDIKGYKESADIKKGLQAHTCYSYQGSIAVDQGFSLEQINIGEFYLPNFDVCMEANLADSDASVKLEKCSKNAMQKFILNSNGSISLQDNQNLCLTISSERSQEGGGGNPPHLIRNLTLENCDLTQLNYQAWATRKH
tara:strand:- start:1007 stop:1552 length:546 start_codon:yes stop_codon:yes gene_type:complete